MSNPTQKDRVMFHPAQLAALEKAFPEVIGDPCTSEAEFRHRAGQRSVLEWVRKSTKITGVDINGRHCEIG